MKEVMIWLNLMGIGISTIMLIGLIFVEDRNRNEELIMMVGIFIFLVCNTIVICNKKL